MSGRIRTIKPEILEDEHATSLSDTAWRLWVSLWVLADDHGNVRLGARYLAANVWQDTTRDPSEPLEELIAAGFISPYAVRSQRYGSIRGWSKHQRVDNAGKPRVPAPSEDDGTWDQALTAVLAPIRGESPPVSARASRARAVRPPDHDPDQRPTTPTKDQSTAAVAAPSGSDEPSTPDRRSTKQKAIPFLEEPGSAPAKSSDADAVAVFDHWVTAWRRVIGGTRPPTLNDKRRGKIRARLREGFTVADLRRAIDGVFASAWNVDNHHYDIELVCRDEAHVQRYIAKADEELPARSKCSNLPPLDPSEIDDGSTPPPSNTDDDPLEDLVAHHEAHARGAAE